MKSKEISMQVKEAIIRLKKQHKSIRETAETLGVAKSTVGYILKKKEITGELNNIERPGRPRKTTKVDDRRILSLVKKNPFTTSTEVKNTLEKVCCIKLEEQEQPTFCSLDSEKICSGRWITPLPPLLFTLIDTSAGLHRYQITQEHHKDQHQSVRHLHG
ncbi:hypothetical protein PDJAM_G00165100 [Pangasius djambal]|uniref:Uncharacterized protein n=1 Tax=Pangasius djambal TaxID=1691987 RepID=A0ACC5ZK95_9TELE|nr:hypothetical protein [Pangasius djambal]